MKTIMRIIVPLLIAATPIATVRAQSPSPASSAQPMASASPAAGASPGTWDPWDDMQRMQSEMNQFFSRAMTEFRMNQNFPAVQNDAGFASSIDVRDKGDHYEVHAFLPGADVNSVKVTADSINVLRVAATQTKQEKKNIGGSEEMMKEFGDYEQLVTLPGPAQINQMKVDRKEHEVVVTIPKKK
jgi:HSP20 family molecular chaperone IbpA